MIIILSIISIFGLVLSFFMNKKYFLNPLFLFFLLTGITHLLASLRLYNLIETSQIVYNIAIIGEIGVILGGLLANKICFKNKFKINNLEKFIRIDGSKVLKSMIIFVFLFELYKLYTIYPLLASGVNLDYIRGIQYGQTINGISYDGGFLYTYICQPLIYLLIPICIICFLNRKILIIKKGYCMILFCSLLMELFTSGGGRMILISFIIQSIIILYYLYKNQEMRFNISKKTKKILFMIGVVALFFIIYSTLNRGDEELKILKSLYYYFIGGIPNTGIHLQSFDGKYTYGLAFFSSLLRFPIELLGLLFNYQCDLYNIAINIPMTLGQTITNVGNGAYNSFVTIFYYFYYDGGYIGVFLCSFMYGYFIQKIMKKYLLYKNYEYLVLLILVFTSIIYVTMRYSYIYIFNFMCLIYWCFCFKLLKIEIK